jgi:hypothetical protein
MGILDFIKAIQAGRVQITHHAYEEAEADEFTFDEIYFSVLVGQIIEEYPYDEPYPSCLIYGQNFSGDHIHSVWAYNESTGWIVLITVYRPDPDLWINWRERRS